MVMVGNIENLLKDPPYIVGFIQTIFQKTCLEFYVITVTVEVVIIKEFVHTRKYKMKTIKKYTVIKDTREQLGWDFKGMIEGKLQTGDYSIVGLENIFTIERKANTAELAKNINEKRFERELIRMDSLPNSFLILEFTLEDVLQFPFNSTIPKSKWKYLRVSSGYILKRILRMEIDHKVKIIFAGSNGKYITERIFSEMMELYGELVK